MIVTACELRSFRFQNCFLVHKEASASLRIDQGNPFDLQYQDRKRTISELEGQEDFPCVVCPNCFWNWMTRGR